MTNGGIRALMGNLTAKLSRSRIILFALAVVLPIIGFFVAGLSVGQTLLGIIILGTAGYLVTTGVGRKALDWIRSSPDDGEKEDVYHHPPEDPMKTLMFDDYQSSPGGKPVARVQEDEVIPSARSTNPVRAVAREQKVRQFEVSDFVDLETDPADVEPRNELHLLLDKSMRTLRDVLFAHSAAFLWVNHEKKQLVLESRSTDSQNFSPTKRYDVEGDPASKVALDGKPQFHGRITPLSEKELVRYYTAPEYVKSVVAVPVFYPGEADRRIPIGVVVADSKAEDAYGPETLELLGHFTKLISAIVRSHTGKYDLLLDSELLTSLRRYNDRVKADPSEYMVLTSLADEANRLVNWDYLTVVMYAEEKQGWMIQKVVNKSGTGYVAPDQQIDFGSSLVGRAIKSNKVESVEDWSQTRPVRFFADEAIDSKGSFICVPISSFNRCYGSLTLESRNKKNFAGHEVETIYRLVEAAAASLEVIYMNDLVKDYVIVDQVTGSFNQRHFLKKLDQEVQRANDFGTELALATVMIDDRQVLCDRYGKEGFETILNQVARTIRGSIRTYDVVGRLEDDRLGVLLIHTTASDGYLWAEKMRKQIASQIITMDGKSFSVTISAGVCGMIEGMHREELLQGTSQVLHKALQGGGNLVRVF